MTAPVWQSRTQLAAGSGANAIVTYPASIAPGDLIICHLYKENTAAVTTIPGGWSEITGGGIPAATTGSVSQSRIFYYIAGGGETGTITFAWTGAVWRSAGVHRIDGQWLFGDPMDKKVALSTGGGTASTLPVSIPDAAPESLHLLLGTDWAGGNQWSPPGGGWVERSDNDTDGAATFTNTPGGDVGSVSLTANVSGALTMTMITVVGTNGPATPAAGPDLYVNRSGRRLG